MKTYLHSECGNYFVIPTAEHQRFELCHVDGRSFGLTTFWINRSDAKRIRFETGSGPVSAIFSYPRYPAWFYRRWIEIWKISFKAVVRLAKRMKLKVLTAYKPDMNCWHHLGLRGTPEMIRAFDMELRRRHLKFETRRKRGRWGIECPLSARPQLERQLRLVQEVSE